MSELSAKVVFMMMHPHTMVFFHKFDSQIIPFIVNISHTGSKFSPRIFHSQANGQSYSLVSGKQQKKKIQLLWNSVER